MEDNEGITEEALAAARLMPVFLIDGFHRLPAIWIIKNNPERLLSADLGIDWQLVSERFPSWVSVTRQGKVGVLFYP